MDNNGHGKKDAVRAARKKSSRLKKLAVFLFVTAAVVVLGIAAWRLILADKLKDYILALAEESINGRIEYDSIGVNVITGRARVKGLRIFLVDGTEPVINVPAADVDVFALRNKNVILSVDGARITLVREKDGSINLESLYKPPAEKKKPEWDISISFGSLGVDFTDKCGIPAADIARIRESDGMLRFEEWLSDLGLEPQMASDGFFAALSLDRLSGIFRSIAATEVTSVDLRGYHGVTPFKADFRSDGVSGRASGNLEWNDDSFETIAKYAEQASPFIAPLGVDMQLRGLTASYARSASGESGVALTGRIEDAIASIPGLPRFSVKVLAFEFDSGSGQLRVKNLKASYGDARLAAAGEVSLKESTLEVSAELTNLDMETFPAEIPVQGVLDASVKVDGKFDSPAIRGAATLSRSRYDNINLGTISARFDSNKSGISLETVSMSGGDVSATGSGTVTMDGAADISFSIPPTSVATFAKLAETNIPAAGRVSISGNLKYSAGKGLRISGNAASPELTANNAVVSQVRAGFNFDGRSASIQNLTFNWDAGGGVRMRTLANVKTGYESGGRVKINASGSSILEGLMPLERQDETRPAADLVGLFPMPDDSWIFYDPDAPKKGTVVYSTDPSRIGLEVWWPRQPEDEAGEDEDGETINELDSVRSSGDIEDVEPAAPPFGWLVQGILSAQAPPGAFVVHSSKHPEIGFDVEAEITPKSGSGGDSFNASGELTLDGLFLRPITVELSGEGDEQDARFYATATGRYKMRGFTARAGYGFLAGKNDEYDIHLLYGNSDFTLNGELDTQGGAISAKVTSEAIQLEDLLDLEGIYGAAALDGVITGTLANPEAKGSLEIESAEYTSSTPPYPVFDIRDGAVPFSYSKGTMHIANGRTTFGSSLLSLAGMVSGGEMSVRLSSDDFSLEDISREIAPDVVIEGGGVLDARLTGTLHHPKYALDFTQDSGSVNGIPFGDAALSAYGDLEMLHLTALRVKSEGGSVKAIGDLSLDEEHRVSANLELEKFQIGLIAPLFMRTTDASLAGLVDGNAELRGTFAALESDVAIELTGGRILDQDIEGVLEFATTRDEIFLNVFEVSAGDSTVLMEGVIRDNIAESELSIDIPYLDLALVNPFLNFTEEEGFWGVISGGTNARRGERGTYMSGYMSGSGGLGFGVIALAGVSGNFDVFPDAIELREFKFTTEDSVLEVDGDLPIKLLSPEARRAIEEGTLRDLPAGLAGAAARGRAPHEAPASERFNLSLRAENFQLDYITSILPETGLAVGGTVSANLEVGGTPEFPVVEGAVEFAVRDFDYQNLISVGSVDGKIVVDYDADLVAQTFELENFVVGEPEAGGDQPPTRRRTGDDVNDKAVHNITLEGGGSFRLLPFTIYELGIVGSLNNFDRFQLSNIYRGPVAGEITIEKDMYGPNVHIGGSVTLRRGGTFTLHAPDPHARPPGALPITLGSLDVRAGSYAPGAVAPPQSGSAFAGRQITPFKIYIEEGVNVRFPPMVDLRAEIQSAIDDDGRPSPLLIQGDFPNVSISGRLQSYKGSLIVLRHTFRVVDPPFEIRFDPMWGMVPYLRGRAAVVISQRGEGGLAGFDGFSDDLTVFVNLDSLATELDEISLSSDPPLSRDEIARRMLGVLPPEGSVQGITPEIREELYRVVGARVGRILEDKLNLEQFILTIGDENEFYIDIEKEITDRLSVLYSTELFGSDRSENKEQFGIRYLFLKKRLVRAYVEAMYDNSDSKFQGNEIRIMLRRRF